MPFDWSTFALQTLNFAILVWLLHRFLYRPVLRLVDARRADIARQYAEAHRVESEAQQQLAAVAAARDGIAAERAAALKDAAAEADRAAARRRAEAEREAAQMLAAARKTLDAERREALAEARRIALDLGADIACRLLAELPAPARSDLWRDKIAEHLAALSPPERAALAGRVANGQALTVITATELPSPAQQQWRVRLQQALGVAPEVAFTVDPALIAGADLHFPNAVLHFSWRDALAAMADDAEPC